MRGRTTILFVLLALLCAVLFVVDVAVGSISIPFAEVVNVLLGKGSAEMRSIVLDIRLVRALTAILEIGRAHV